MSACAGCGGPLAPNRGQGPPRKWCSERCRKAQYGGTCADCGGRTYGGNGRANAPERCDLCERHRNDERNRQLVEMWEAGTPTSTIAAQLGMSEVAVRSWVDFKRRRRGVPIPLRRRRDRELWPEIQRRWNAGESGYALARDYGVTPQCIYNQIGAMREEGYDLADHGRNGRKVAA